MKVGAILPAADSDGGGRTPTWDEVRAFTLAAEERGLDSVWMYDHLFYCSAPDETEGQHEA